VTSASGPPRRAPHECPVCRDQLHVTQLGCEQCGTGISGEFQQCDFCALETKDLEVLRVFLASRGNMKDLERHLGVSYPTARGRFDDLLRKLGLGSPTPPVQIPIEDGESRLATLRALAVGQLGVEEARQKLSGS
jgi:hypothetical protein